MLNVTNTLWPFLYCIYDSIAGLLLREDETVWTMCTGIFKDRLLVSIRNTDQNNRADRVIKPVVAKTGTGGGHLTYSGGQIPMNNSDQLKTEQLAEKISKRFLKIIGADESQNKKLVPT